MCSCILNDPFNYSMAFQFAPEVAGVVVGVSSSPPLKIKPRSYKHKTKYPSAQFLYVEVHEIR